MRNKITRKDKKKLRAIILCHTGNADSRKSTYSKEQWFNIRTMYAVWLSCVTMDDRRMANSIHKYKIKI